jgi:hypothetical protein
MDICCENKQIINTYSTKFLRLFTDGSLSRNNHFDQLMSKLRTACYDSRNIKGEFFFLVVVPFSHMVQLFGVIHPSVIISLRYKKE